MRKLGRSVTQLVWRRLQSSGPRTRFVALGCASLLGRQVDVNILRDLAQELERDGANGWARRCWSLIHRLVPFDAEGLMGRLARLVADGDLDRVRALVEQSRLRSGFPPARLVWLAGQLACHEHWREAAGFLRDLAGEAAVEQLVRQSPSVVSAHVPRDLAQLARALQATADGGAEGDRSVVQQLARLCFTFGHLDVAAALYRQSAARLELPWIDRVAMHYARARAHPETHPLASEEWARLLDGQVDDPDALAMLAYAALDAGRQVEAADALERAIRVRYANDVRLGEVLRDSRSIAQVIWSLRGQALLPDALLERARNVDGSGLPKVFICGFGWSGSGAVYDDVRAVRGFCEFEGAGLDPILNEDSETEVTFIQSTAGLGDLWVRAKSRRRLEWQWLWDLFTVHVVGLAPIGYSNYKSCAAAANHVRRYGHLYTRPFRDFFEAYAGLVRTPVQGGLHALLRETTEKLCAMLVGQTGGKAVLFNNAVFGRDAEMLEIFSACHAVAVFRDPLDVYADRKDKDRNHWRTPRQLAEFYGRGLQRYLAYRTAAGTAAGAVLREIPFERFVTDGDFRRRVRDWLLSGLADDGETRFDPEVSSRNVGFHRGRIDAREAAQLEPAMAACRRMRALSDAAWRD